MIDFGGAVAWMSMPPVLGRFLLRLVHELAPRSSVEFGTGFGISAAYQAAALELAGAGRLVSIDVVPVWSQIARTGFAELGLMRVEAVVAEDGRAQERLIEAAAPIDYALVDSDHRENATLAALERLAPHLSPEPRWSSTTLGLPPWRCSGPGGGCVRTSWSGMRSGWDDSESP